MPKRLKDVPSDLAIVTLLSVWPQVAAAQGHNPNACITATRIAIDVLRHFRITARPIACSVTATNAAANALLDAGKEPKTEGWPNGSFAVGIRPHEGPKNPLTYNGHLVAVIDDAELIVDLTLPQLNRPEYDIEFTPIVLSVPGLAEKIKAERQMQLTTPNGARAAYRYEPALQGTWRTTLDWPRDLRRTVNAVIEVMNPLIEHALAEERSQTIDSRQLGHSQSL